MKLLYILIDGCRVDTLTKTHTPNIDRLMAQGSWTLEAQTVTPSLTQPVLYSIFTSTPPDVHGVTDNTTIPMAQVQSTTFVEYLREMGRTSAFFYNWEQIKSLTPSGQMHTSLFMNNSLMPGGDLQLARMASSLMLQEMPDFAYLYLGCLDEEGHRSGYGSPRYEEALAVADRAVGAVLSTLESAGKLCGYTVVLQSDHGGVDFDHNEPDEFVMTVPWIASGPKIRKGFCIENPVSVLDTIPTCARIMGVMPSPAWKGRVLAEIFE